MTTTQNTQKKKPASKLQALLNFKFSNDESAEMVRKFKAQKEDYKETILYTAFALLEHRELLEEISPSIDTANDAAIYAHYKNIKSEHLADMYFFIHHL